jgi:hypothetical protein
VADQVLYKLIQEGEEHTELTGLELEGARVYAQFDKAVVLEV